MVRVGKIVTSSFIEIKKVYCVMEFLSLAWSLFEVS